MKCVITTNFTFFLFDMIALVRIREENGIEYHHYLKVSIRIHTLLIPLTSLHYSEVLIHYIVPMVKTTLHPATCSVVCRYAKFLI